jgi:hypothetical protein
LLALFLGLFVLAVPFVTGFCYRLAQHALA